MPQRPYVILFLLPILVLAGAFGHFTRDVSAHSYLTRSDPASGSLQAGSPESVSLWFSERMDAERSSVTVYDETRQRVDTGETQVGPDDPRRLSVDLEPLLDGIYTVSWTSASTEDSHVLNGTFSFRVGRGRVPGAASVDGEQPSASSVILRWTTLAGLTTVTGWLLLGMLGAAYSTSRWRVALFGGGLAILADLLLGAMQIGIFGGAVYRGLSSGIGTMHWSWLVRLLLLSALMVLLALERTRSGLLPIRVSATALAAMAVVTMSFTSHAAAAGELRAPALASNALHLLSTAFWIGGVLHLALARWQSGPVGDPARRFSRLAVFLALLAVGTGILNAGVTLPSFTSLWSSQYGQILLVKSAVVIGILGFAWLNRQWIQRGAERVLTSIRSLRVEAALGGLAILLGTTLALSAPPAPAHEEPFHLRMSTGDGRFAHLVIDPPESGRVAAEVWLTDKDGQTVRSNVPPMVSFSMLERVIDLEMAVASPGSEGRWQVDDLPLTVKGWWRASVLFAGSDEAEVEFVMLLPDPARGSAERGRSTEDQARDLFQAAIARLTELQSLRSVERLADSIGNSVETRYRYLAPDRQSYVTSSGNEGVSVGDTLYFRRDGGEWLARERNTPFAFPEMLPAFYSGATEHTLGRQEEIDGEVCQLISFYVPEAPGREESWYLWWVGTETGLIRSEAMAGRYHYMTSHYTGHDEPVVIEAPETARSD